MKNSDTASNRHQKFFEEANQKLKTVSSNVAQSIVCESVAQHQRLSELLTESRMMVEENVCHVIDAMDIVFDKNGAKIKQLESLVEKTTSQVAFLKTSLSTVSLKTAEVDCLIQRLEKLNSAVDKFNAFVDSGCFDMVASAARAIDKA